MIAVASTSRRSELGRARALIRALIQKVEWAMRNREVPWPHGPALDQLRAICDKAWSNAAAAGYVRGFLLAYVAENGDLSTLAYSGVQCYRLRAGGIDELTRARGTAGPASPVLSAYPAEEGDVFLICTRGVFEALPRPRILRALRDERYPHTVAGSLVAEARAAADDADATAVVMLTS